ncbi:MAG: GNAT family N-acetyltransferase [Lachnospiraceae bacterium]|nr:GNAT family N-acetyltransferase [Lachnospiraceae bacterium]
MRVRIETERLIMRPMVPEDYQAAFKWCGDPKVNKYMIYPLYKRAEDVKTWIESLDYDNPDNYDMGIELKETGELIGSGGLCYSKKREAWVVGYNLRADMWGKGYAVEAMQGIIDEISKTRKINRIMGDFCVENHKSQRVMEKLGMHYYKDSEYEKLDGSEKFKAKVYIKEFS